MCRRPERSERKPGNPSCPAFCQMKQLQTRDASQIKSRELFAQSELAVDVEHAEKLENRREAGVVHRPDQRGSSRPERLLIRHSRPLLLENGAARRLGEPAALVIMAIIPDRHSLREVLSVRRV